MLDKKILFTGGGSGGHISAATAILDGIKSRYTNWREKVLYVGSNLGMVGEEDSRSLEQRLFEKSEVPFIAIRAGKLQRYFSISTVKLLWGVIGGFIDAWRVIKDFKPDLIISTGGFVTVPICFVGWVKHIPIYIHEQTAAVGLTNKIASKFAKRVYISFPQSAQYFPSNKVLHVGNAVREKIFDMTGKGEAADAIQLMLREKEKLPILLITGGGQGSHIINITVRQMIPYLVTEFQVLLQTGDNQVNRDYEILWKEKLKLPENLRHRFHPVKFISADEIGNVFHNSDIYIGRAGANFVYEMGVLKKPSIFIPIPWVTHNEQYKNAKSIEELGFGVILPEGELTAERLFNEIKKLSGKIKNGQIQVDVAKAEETFPTNAVERILKDLNL